MFDFEKLEVYQKAKLFNKKALAYIAHGVNLNKNVRNQLERASLSIMLNIAEGSGRFSKADRRNFFIIARGSVFECVAIFDFLKDENMMTAELNREFYNLAEELSKMLYTMVKNLNTQKKI